MTTLRFPYEVGQRTANRLSDLISIVSQSGNPDLPFWYLGGPMSGIAQFNFPRFEVAGSNLRRAGYNIVSPAELDEPEVFEQAINSPDGDAAALSRSHEELLSRDLIVVSLPTCLGMICLEGWEHSLGAAGESWVVSFLGKTLLAYHEVNGYPVLEYIERDEKLAEMGAVSSGTLPARLKEA